MVHTQGVHKVYSSGGAYPGCIQGGIPGLYASLLYLGGYIPYYMSPYHTLPGTPRRYTVHTVHPGTLSPAGTVPDDEVLGSNPVYSLGRSL